MKKRVIAFSLTLCLLAGLLVLPVSAANPANVYSYLKSYAMSGTHNSDKTIYKNLFYTDEYEEEYFIVEYYTSEGWVYITRDGRNYTVSLVLKPDMSLPYDVEVRTEYGNGAGTLPHPERYTEKTNLTLDYFVGYSQTHAEEAEKTLSLHFPDLLEYLLLVIDAGGYSLKDLRFSKFTRHTVHIDRQQSLVTPPTCSEPGTARFVCKLCGRQIVKEVPPTGIHSWRLEELLYEGATAHESYASYVCTVCGQSKRSRLCAGEIFTDMPKEGNWAHDSIDWANFSGITGGKSATRFAPKDSCTREQIVTFLWKAAGAPEPSSTNNPFTDIKSGKYYYKAVLWAVESGITGGVSKDQFGLGRPCTREQAMSFLWKACASPEPGSAENPFTDIKEDKYYYKAILWAVENHITGGVDATHFGVGKACTRAQILTFLYKACELLSAVTLPEEA